MMKALTAVVLLMVMSVSDAQTLYRARMMLGTDCAPSNMTELMFEFKSGECALFKADGPLSGVLPADLGLTFTVNSLDQIDMLVALGQCGSFLGLTVKTEKGKCVTSSLFTYSISATLLDAWIVQNEPEPTLPSGTTSDPASDVVISDLHVAVGYFADNVNPCSAEPLPTYTVPHGACVMQQNNSMVGEVYGRVECFGLYARYSASLNSDCSETTTYQGYPVSLPYDEVVPIGTDCVEGFLKVGADTTTSTSVVVPYYVSLGSCYGVNIPATIPPTDAPTVPTTATPTTAPTAVPTHIPAVTSTPTDVPTTAPAPVTVAPTMVPGVPTTIAPTSGPTTAPAPVTVAPTMVPGVPPTVAPTGVPIPPTIAPTMAPGVPPTVAPTVVPTTVAPTMAPGVPPTIVPTMTPGVPPTAVPTTAVPTIVPTMTPGTPPTATPTGEGTPVPFQPAAPDEDSSSNTLVIILIVCGSLLVVAFAVVVFFLNRKPPTEKVDMQLEKQILEANETEQLQVINMEQDTIAE